MSLKDKVAVITGAGQGIGAAVTRRLHADGTHVVAFLVSDECSYMTGASLVVDGGLTITV